MRSSGIMVELHKDVRYDELFTIQLHVGCFRITRMVTGNIKSRPVYPGVLTPSGIAAAKALQR